MNTKLSGSQIYRAVESTLYELSSRGFAGGIDQFNENEYIINLIYKGNIFGSYSVDDNNGLSIKFKDRPQSTYKYIIKNSKDFINNSPIAEVSGRVIQNKIMNDAYEKLNSRLKPKLE